MPVMTDGENIRFKGQTLRLVTSLLVGLLVLLAGGLIGVALMSTLIAAAAAAILVWLAWLGLKRLYFRVFRPRLE